MDRRRDQIDASMIRITGVNRFRGYRMRMTNHSTESVRRPPPLASQLPRLALLALLLTLGAVHAEEPGPKAPAQAVDETDTAPDEETDSPTKPWYRSLVPLPVIITEPAIGEGLGLALGYFHPEKAGNYRPRRLEDPTSVRDISVGQKPPPTATGVFGAYTSNGTWAGGIAHMDTFRNDTIRYTGAAAYANVIADFYVNDQPFEFNLEGLLIYNDVKFRLGKSDWFLGAALSYLDATNTFSVSLPQDITLPLDFLAEDFTDIGLKARAMYETRDESIMPRSGWLLDASLTRNDQALGGSYDYTTAKLKALYFRPLTESVVLGLRIESASVFGDPPFFAVPWVNLRGIPAMRYQGDTVSVAEIEGRYYFNENWLANAFLGKGWASSDIAGIETQQSIRAWGVGGRYRLLKDQGVWVGVDYAIGPEDNVYYITVGQGW
jgi:hypothetical protein